MMQAHYPLQALLYSVALHRMLRWRQPGYDPSVHLGGVLYLFVRGMAGRDTPRVDGMPCGVFSWRPAAGAGHRAVRPAGRSGPMTSTGVQPPSPAVETDVLLAHGASGLLATFNAAGALGVADVRTAEAVGRIAGEPDETVRLALALTVRALRNGSVCIDLATRARHGLRRVGDRDGDRRGRPALARPADLARAVRAEPAGDRRTRAGRWAAAAAGRRPALPGALLAAGGAGPSAAAGPAGRRPARGRPRPAARRAAPAVPRRSVSRRAKPIGSGWPPPSAPWAGSPCWPAVPAPARPPPSPGCWRCCATSPAPRSGSRWPPRPARRRPGWRRRSRPRGRDAGRGPGTARRDLRLHPAPAARLAAGSPSRFRHDANNQLPHDVVIVDEMSMVSLTLMARLLEAVRPTRPADPGRRPRPALLGRGRRGAGRHRPRPRRTRPGAGRTAPCPRRRQPGRPGTGARRGPAHPHLALRRRGAIDALAQAIRDADPDAALRGAAVRVARRSGSPRSTSTRSPNSSTPRSWTTWPARCRRPARPPWPPRGPATSLRPWPGWTSTGCCAPTAADRSGVLRWSLEVERWLAEALPGYAEDGEWYVGRPLLVTANDYDMSLYNGDTGVIVEPPEGVRAAFARGAAPSSSRRSGWTPSRPCTR